MLSVSKKRYTFATKQLTIISRKTQLREKNSNKNNKKNKEEMKKILIMLAVLFMASTVSVNAQDDDKAKAKAEAKAKKAEEKAEKKRKKEEAKEDPDRYRKIAEEYEKFMETYEPLKATGFADVDAIIVGVNGIFASLNGIYEKIGYIVVEDIECIEEGELTTSQRIYNRRTGEDIDKDTAKQRFKEVSSEIVPIVESAGSLAAGAMNVNPINLVAIMPQINRLRKQAKFIVKVSKGIQAQIKMNKEALGVEG